MKKDLLSGRICASRLKEEINVAVTPLRIIHCAHRRAEVSGRPDGVYLLAPDEVSRFSYPAAGEIGNSGRNSFRGPRYFNTDASLIKRFHLFETHSLTFRAEGYNVFNNANFIGLIVNLDTPSTFGKFSGTAAARILQLAPRYDF